MSRFIAKYLLATAIFTLFSLTALGVVVAAYEGSVLGPVAFRFTLGGLALGVIGSAMALAWRIGKRIQPPLREGAYLKRLLANMSEALLVVDPSGQILRANAAAGHLLDCPAERLVGRSIAGVLAGAGGSGAPDSETHDGQMSPRDGRFARADGSTIAVSYTVSELRDENGRLEAYIYAAQNIEERKRAEKRIRYLARTDPLTKLSNRMQFQHQLQQSISRAKRSAQYLALLYLDIDRFKDINDTFGHAAGDKSLETFARRIAQQLPHGCLAGRLAGDEFAVLLPGHDTMDRFAQELRAVAANLLDAIGKPFRVQGEEIFITASIGTALYPRDGDNATDLIRNADVAMYQAKRAGGNCFESYSIDMNTAAVDRLMLKSKLRRAFECKELRLHYQPKYRLLSGRVEGVEALVRWDLPERGLVFPSDFIPIAEETNLIQQIGDWVLDRVCSDYRQWQRSVPSPCRVSVNLSLKQLQQRHFLERFKAIFASHGVSPTCLELEITETTLMEDAQRTIKVLESLHRMGLRLAIDDFGTGYSSLSALQQFPISTLKIDQSFVRNVAVNRDDAAMVSTIIQMARNLKMEVVAEGVESVEQLDFLRRHGCDYAQGHLFGDPTTADGFLELISAQSLDHKHDQALGA